MAICATVLTACEKTSVDSAFISNGTVKAFIAEEESQTRTALNGSKIIWSKDDKISIFTEYTNNTFKNNLGTITQGEGTTSADFTVVYEEGYTKKVLAVYPYNANTSYNGKVTINMPNTYSYTEGSINGFPMAAIISDQNAPISFKNAGALMQLTVNNIPAGYNSATLAANTPIAGECLITFIDGIPSMTASNNADNNKKIVISWEPSSQMTNKTFYFPLPIADYDNLTFSISNGLQTININSKALDAQRSKRYTGAWTLGVESGSTPTEASSASAATDTLAGGATAVNVTISESETATPTLSLPKQNTPESTPTTLSFSSIPAGKTVTIQEANGLTNEEKPSEEVYIYASSDTNSNNSFDINLPQSTVTLNATTGTAVYETVTALTADNTLVVGNGVTVNNLVVKGGNVRVRGSIESISRHKDNENPVYLYVEEGAKIPANLPAGIQTATMVKNADEFNAAVKGTASVIVLAEHFMDVPEILTINRPLTLDGNNKNIGSDASRAINVDTDGVVTIKNISINGNENCERGINIINKAGTTNIDHVTISPLSHYAVHVASSAGAAKVNITNSNLTSWGAVAVYGEGSVVNVTESCLTGENRLYKDNEGDSFATIDAGYGDVTINVIGGTISAISKEGMDNMAIVGAKAGATGANIYLKSNLQLDGLNTCYISMPIEGNTVKIQNGDAQTISQKYPYTFGEPDKDFMVQVTGVAEGVAVITEIKELYDAAADEDINHIVLAANIPSITETVEINHDLTITINGYNFVNNVKAGRAFKVAADGVNFSLNAVNSNVTFGNDTYGIVEIANDVDNAVVAIEGGNFEGVTNAEKGGTFVRFRNGNNNTVSLTKLTYTDNYKFTDGKEYNPWVVYGTEGTGNTLNVDGGTYNVPCGFNLYNVTSNFNNITLYAIGQGMELSGSNGKYELNGCKIMLNPGGIAYSAPGACVAASYMSTINVEGGELTANQAENTYTLAVYPTGGYINYDSSKTKLIGKTKVWDMYDGAYGAITDTSSLPE